MNHSLVIIASGKSTRFGGFPKAFCSLGKMRNVERTIALAKPYFEEIFVVVNQETYAAGFCDQLDAKTISIVTGQGDADSLLKALQQIRMQLEASGVVVACWGDAIFVSEEPFRKMKEYTEAWNTETGILVGCSVDQEPYAWFETNGNMICRSHFRKLESNPCSEGLHDQSIFAFRFPQIISYLEQYKKYLELDVYDQDTYEASRGEMKLLDAFAYFYDTESIPAAEWRMLPGNLVQAFNTKEELDQIIKSMVEN